MTHGVSRPFLIRVFFQVDFLSHFLQTMSSTGAVSLKRESCLIQERSRRCNPDPGACRDKRLCR